MCVCAIISACGQTEDEDRYGPLRLQEAYGTEAAAYSIGVASISLKYAVVVLKYVDGLRSAQEGYSSSAHANVAQKCGCVEGPCTAVD